MPVIKFPKPERMYIPKHQTIETWDEDVIFLWGGRFGAKSESVARWLTKKSLKNPHMKCVLARKTHNAVKDSNYEQIKNYIDSKNISEFFRFTKSPLEINCASGAVFISRGFDKAEKIKGISNPSDFWIEEAAEITEQDFETAVTTLRNDHMKPQMWLTFNPEYSGDLNDFWLYNRFFRDRESFDFVDSFEIEISGKKYMYKIRSVHTTYNENPFAKANQIAKCESYKADYEKTKSESAKYNYEVWTLGRFGNKLTERPYLHAFASLIHTGMYLYDNILPLHISFDKNVNPYLPCSVFQYRNDTFYQIHEFALKHPDNRTHTLALQLVKWLKSIKYSSKIYIYGDATATAENTDVKVGMNFFKIIENELFRYGYVTELRVPGIRTNRALIRRNSNPHSQNAGDYMNYLIENNRVLVSDTCIKSINDYANAPQDRNGGIDKSQKDKATGGDKWGHFTDILKYFICEFNYTEFTLYSQDRRRVGV